MKARDKIVGILMLVMTIAAIGTLWFLDTTRNTAAEVVWGIFMFGAFAFASFWAAYLQMQIRKILTKQELVIYFALKDNACNDLLESGGSKKEISEVKEKMEKYMQKHKISAMFVDV